MKARTPSRPTDRARVRWLGRIARLAVSAEPLDVVLDDFAEAVGALVEHDALVVSLIDAERQEYAVLDPRGRAGHPGHGRNVRQPLAGTLLGEVAASRGARVIEDAEAAGQARADGGRLLGDAGYRSLLLAPLIWRGEVMGAVVLGARGARAFRAGAAEQVEELGQPLVAAIVQRRLLDESRGRAGELAALSETSRLITARLDLPSVLEAISRSVTGLIGGTGCAIALLTEDRSRLEHVAAHGLATARWRGRSLAVGEGVTGRCAQRAAPVRVDDLLGESNPGRADVEVAEGLRSALCVPLAVGGRFIGVVSAFSTAPAAFTAHHQRVLEAFAEQAGVAIHNAQLFEQSARRARETRALLEAGRAVTATLDLGKTVRVILEEARSVLGVESCSVMQRDGATGDLVTVASLDLSPETASQIRLRVGEGIAGLAVSERRPVQSADLDEDARVRYRELSRGSGFRSIMAAPLRAGEAVIGAITVLRRDVHRFTADEEQLLLALADQAAIALEHARLYTQLEAMVAERTRELDAQKRFVEVVLEALPLGVFVLDERLAVVRVNREGFRLLGLDAVPGAAFPALLPGAHAGRVRRFLEQAFGAARLSRLDEEEMAVAGEPRLFRFVATPIEPAGAHLVVLVEDMTLAKRLERQLLLTERLTVAGRLAAGVAHELNNPLATIAGCAEALRGRLGEAGLATLPEAEDFRHYLGLIEEEAYRCKEITSSLLGFVREPGSRRTATDLNALVVKTVDLLSHQSRFSRERFATELAPDLPGVTVNEGQLRQVFLGLATNALDAMGPEGTLRVRTRQGRGEVAVEFEDEGPGIAGDVLPRIFDPFFTTKPPGQGTGLGLAIAQSIVTDHGGRIDVTSHVGKGSIFRVVLPR